MTDEPSPEQIANYEAYCQEVAGAMAAIVDQAVRLGYAAPLTIAAFVGALAAIAVAAGVAKENVIAGLNSAWDDIGSTP